MTSAWLDLLLQRQEFHHSIVFVVEEILPSYQNWRFNNPIEKETFGQKVLKVIFSQMMVITDQDKNAT